MAQSWIGPRVWADKDGKNNMSNSEFTAKDIEIVNKFLTKHVGKGCLSSAVIYDALKSELNFSKSRFCNNLSASIASNLIKGFELRKGRHGGIHRKGMFDNHDKDRNAEIAREKRQYKKKVYKGVCSNITIKNRKFRARISETKLLTFIINVLEAEFSDDQANVTVATMNFKVRHIDVLELFVTSYCGTEKVDESN